MLLGRSLIGCVAKYIFNRMPGKLRRSRNVVWDMYQKHLHTRLHFLGKKSLRKEVQRNYKCCVRVPIGLMKRNLVGVEYLCVSAIRPD